jgi:hypothetical protein
MEHNHNKTLSLYSSLALFCVVMAGTVTTALAEDNLTGCWVGQIGGENTYLYFADNSKCTFNQGTNNCVVTFPLENDSNHNIQLDYKDDKHNLRLMGNADDQEIQGDDFSFSRGDSCPLPSSAVQPIRAKKTPVLKSSSRRPQGPNTQGYRPS